MDEDNSVSAYSDIINESQREINRANDDYRADKIDIMDTKKDLPTIDIHGKEYVMVKDRVLAFNERYPHGAIITEATILNDKVLFKATAYPDTKNKDRYFTGHSSASKGSQGIEGQRPVEVAETSAVGRALAFMGIGVIESIASAEEVISTPQTREPQEYPQVKKTYTPSTTKPASEKQKQTIEKSLNQLGQPVDHEWIDSLTSASASVAISKLFAEIDEAKNANGYDRIP